MRLWSIHPSYLDRLGLVAVWREGLLAQKALQEKTKGYKYHPQLTRFKQSGNPLLFIGNYLYYIYEESQRRGYKFNIHKINLSIDNPQLDKKLIVTTGQLEYEFNHLQFKLSVRDKNKYNENNTISCNRRIIEPHPLFKVINGKIESWEKL